MKITSNKSKRTFTIRKEDSKFRTLQMSQNEFDECEYNTTEDWKYFLRTQDGNYYEVKK
tara:strand:+ start:532 stop:708 length:177 start_codon:yes stop_codon:yes gene_type:complete